MKLQKDMNPSNFRLVLESNNKEYFAQAIEMCFGTYSAATHFKIDKDGLHLFWSSSTDCSALPYSMDSEAVTTFAWNWLKKADRGDEPDMDGHCVKDGFIVQSENDDWSSYSLVSIKPVWSMYHK